MFCGAWVDREVGQDLDDDSAAHYQTALEHRDRLLDYDVNAAKRLGVVDERSDWYDLSSNTWLNKDQRKYANQMMELEKKKEKEIEDTNVLKIDFDTGGATVKQDENEWAAFNVQSEQANEYLAGYKPMPAKDIAPAGSKYKPFEFTDAL